MKTKVGTKCGILIKFIPENSVISITTVEIPDKSNVELFNRLLGSNLIDVAEWDKNIDIVVDDESFLVEGNPVFELKTPFGDINLAGNLLFLKKEFNKDGVDLVGMNTGEALKLLMELRNGAINVIGMTTGF